MFGGCFDSQKPIIRKVFFLFVECVAVLILIKLQISLYILFGKLSCAVICIRSLLRTSLYPGAFASWGVKLCILLHWPWPLESDSCWQLTVCWRAEELPLLHLIAGFSSGPVRVPVAPNRRLCLLVLVGSVACMTQRLLVPCSPYRDLLSVCRSFLQAATTGSTLASRNNFKITSRGKRNFQQIT